MFRHYNANQILRWHFFTILTINNKNIFSTFRQRIDLIEEYSKYPYLLSTLFVFIYEVTS
jgi:hypothetical protein